VLSNRNSGTAIALSLLIAGCSIDADPEPTKLESLCVDLDHLSQDIKVEAERQRIGDIRLTYCPP
jgi:hypothetical protein